MAKNQQSFGFLIIDKPTGITSHDVVDRVRRVTGERRVGHAGTLDPAASGVLVVGVGREATKRLGQALRWDKEYVAQVRLGAVSDTDDAEGIITKHQIPASKQIPISKITSTLALFTGEIDQVPPRYAAIKKDGKKLYEYARAGQDVARPPRQVTIHELELLSFTWPNVQLRVVCSSGTYIRALARDIGAALGVGGYLTGLQRTRVGSFSLDASVPLQSLTPEDFRSYLLPVTALD